MAGIEDLLRRRRELLEEIEREIQERHTREFSILFTDIVDSSRFYARWGDIGGRQLVQVHNDLLFPVIADHDGRVIKTIGDSILAVFEDPAQALAATVAMQRRIAGQSESRADYFRFQVRMGLHHGSVVAEEHDVFGDAVNAASRIVALAMAEEILVSEDIVSRLKAPAFPLMDRGPVLLKGRDSEIRLYAVEWRQGGGGAEEGIASAGPASRLDPALAAEGEGTLEPLLELPETPISELAEPRPQASRARQTGLPQARRVSLPEAKDARARAEALPAPPTGNPYADSGRLVHPSRFWGRRAALTRILGQLEMERPCGSLVHGEQGMGKSVLLERLRFPLPERALRSPEAYVFAYIDLSALNRESPESLAELILESLIRDSGLEVEGPLDDTCLSLTLKAVSAERRRLVLMADGLDSPSPGEGRASQAGAAFLDLLRRASIGLVASARLDPDALAAARPELKPLLAQLTPLRLGPLALDEARELISLPSLETGFPLSPLEPRILAMAGRHPAFLRLAASAWFEYLYSRGISAEEADSHAHSRIPLSAFRTEAAPHFRAILEGLSREESLTLRAAADGRLRLEDEDSLSFGLQRKGYLEEDGGRLKPFSEEFARYLRDFDEI